MASFNKVTVLGRVGREPKISYTSGGKCVAGFSVATEEGWGDKKKVMWHNVVAWEKLAGIVEKMIRKGTQVLVDGRLQERTWEKDGVERKVVEIVANSIVVCGSKSDASEQMELQHSHSGARSQIQYTKEPEDSEEPLPF